MNKGFAAHRILLKIKCWCSFIQTMRCSNSNCKTVNSCFFYIMFCFIRSCKALFPIIWIIIYAAHMTKFCFYRYSNRMRNLNEFFYLCNIFLIW